MKRIIAGAFLSLVLLTGCAGEVAGQASQAKQGTSAPAPVTETTTPTPATTEASTPQSGYSQQQGLNDLRSLTPYFDGIPDSDIFELFNSICENLDSGGTIQSVIDAGIEVGVPAGPAGGLVAAAVYSTCSEYSPLIEEYIGD